MFVRFIWVSFSVRGRNWVSLGERPRDNRTPLIALYSMMETSRWNSISLILDLARVFATCPREFFALSCFVIFKALISVRMRCRTSYAVPSRSCCWFSANWTSPRWMCSDWLKSEGRNNCSCSGKSTSSDRSKRCCSTWLATCGTSDFCAARHLSMRSRSFCRFLSRSFLSASEPPSFALSALALIDHLDCYLEISPFNRCNIYNTYWTVRINIPSFKKVGKVIPALVLCFWLPAVPIASRSIWWTFVCEGTEETMSNWGRTRSMSDLLLDSDGRHTPPLCVVWESEIVDPRCSSLAHDSNTDLSDSWRHPAWQETGISPEWYRSGEWSLIDISFDLEGVAAKWKRTYPSYSSSSNSSRCDDQWLYPDDGHCSFDEFEDLVD